METEYFPLLHPSNFLHYTYPVISSSMFHAAFFAVIQNDPGSMNGNYFTSYLKTRIVCETEAPSNNRNITTNDFEYNIVSKKLKYGYIYHQTGMKRCIFIPFFFLASFFPHEPVARPYCQLGISYILLYIFG